MKPYTGGDPVGAHWMPVKNSSGEHFVEEPQGFEQHRNDNADGRENGNWPSAGDRESPSVMRSNRLRARKSGEIFA
jgi:hypothetical protein